MEYSLTTTTEPLPQTPTSTDLIPWQGIPADRNPALVYLASLAAGSRRTMRQALNVVAEILTAGRCDLVTLPWGALRFQHTQAVRAALQERYQTATANKMLAALRQTLRTAWNLGYLTAEEYQRAVDLKPITGEQQTLTVRGKRNKTRVIPIEDAGTLDALADWLYILFLKGVRQEMAGPLFTRITKGGQITQERLTDQGIYHILGTRRQQANMAPFTPHDLRRTFAGDLLDAGVDLSTVQKLMGHANANTTAGYDRRGERAKRDAVRKLHAPYQRRFAE